MKRAHGLVSLAVLHHVTVGIALLAMLANLFSPTEGIYLGTVASICAFGFFSVIVRRAWASIDGGPAGMSPGKAQGFLWIPFFNFYWVFPALVSLATQTNAKSDSEQNPAGRITRGFGLVIAILFSVTKLLDLLSSRHPLLGWIHFLTYATYVGFTVTYIWQIRRSAAAFDDQSAPAVREPTKMPTVGIAGIIYGSGLVALLMLNLNLNLFVTPEYIEQRFRSKGLSVEIDRDATVPGFRSDKAMAEAGVREVGYIKVYRGDKRIAGVYYATGALTSASEEIIAGQLGTRTLRSGDKIFFKAYNRDTGQENLDINAWLNSF
ncbi:MAG: hypothetical protein RLZZ412_1311 [Verrucomicrobiota bacterium]|jgi:hypothetical protein